MVFDTIHRPLFAESKQVYFPNSKPVSANTNGAFCKVRNRCKRKLQSWTKLMKNLDPPPPISKTEKWHIFALRAASSLIWGGADGGLLFNSILSKIVAIWLFKLVQRNESWYSTSPIRFFVSFCCCCCCCFIGCIWLWNALSNLSNLDHNHLTCFVFWRNFVRNGNRVRERL